MISRSLIIFTIIFNIGEVLKRKREAEAAPIITAGESSEPTDELAHVLRQHPAIPAEKEPKYFLFPERELCESQGSREPEREPASAGCDQPARSLKDRAEALAIVSSMIDSVAELTGQTAPDSHSVGEGMVSTNEGWRWSPSVLSAEWRENIERLNQESQRKTAAVGVGWEKKKAESREADQQADEAGLQAYEAGNRYMTRRTMLIWRHHAMHELDSML